MKTPIFENARFVALESDTERFIELASRQAGTHCARSVIEIGCGDGATALALASDGLSVTALDISESSIALARTRAGASQVDFLVADYLKTDFQAADILLAHSVLHLITGDDGALAKKLAREINPGGHLLVTMPDDRVINRVIIACRRLLRALRCPWLDSLILRVAQVTYPDAPVGILNDRVMYMYILPRRLAGGHWHDHLREAGFDLVEQAEWPNTSFAKLRALQLLWCRR